jgi:hypothetical protein
MKTLIYSTNSFDEAMEYLIAEYGLYSDPVDQFFKLCKTDKAIEYARKHGYNVEN